MDEQEFLVDETPTCNVCQHASDHHRLSDSEICCAACVEGICAPPFFAI